MWRLKSTKKWKTEKITMIDLGFLLGKNYFNNDRSQNYLVFQPICNTFTMSAGHTETTIAWKSKGLSNESTTHPTTPGYKVIVSLQNSNGFIIQK